MSTITEIVSASQWSDHLRSLPDSTLLVVLFHAPWAAPCAQMQTVLKTLASEYPVTDPITTSWVSLNAEELSDVSEQYGVSAVPFLVLLRNGTVVDSVSGSSAPKVRAAIEKHAKVQDINSAPAVAAGTLDGASRDFTAGDVAAESSAPVVDAEDPEAAEARRKKELFARLDGLVKASPVMLFMKGVPSASQCGFSRQIVNILRDRSVKYGFFNILADDDVRQGLKEYADWPTYPQLWVDGELVGGLDIVCFYHAYMHAFFFGRVCP